MVIGSSIVNQIEIKWSCLNENITSNTTILTIQPRAAGDGTIKVVTL